MEDNKVFMAVRMGKESVETTFKTYKGMAALKIVALNPTKEELSELTGREISEEPEYKTKNEKGENVIRLAFYAKTDPNHKLNSGIEILVPINFTLTEAPVVGAGSGKYTIIDKYGRTAYATQEDVDSHAIPMYSNGPARISADYRLAYQGEKELINFLIQWLNVPAPSNYKDGVWVDKPNIEESEVTLDMEALFKGDFSELKEYTEMAAAYIVKAAIGVRTVESEKGTRQYHSVFTREFAKNASTNYSKIDAAIEGFQSNGGAPNTEFSTLPLHENVIEATKFEPSEGSVPSEASPTPWG
jgi:hypothetical protein